MDETTSEGLRRCDPKVDSGNDLSITRRYTQVGIHTSCRSLFILQSLVTPKGMLTKLDTLLVDQALTFNPRYLDAGPI